MFFRIKAYFGFLMHSKNQYGVHSPFIYDLIINCLYDKKKHPAYRKIKKYRTDIRKEIGKKESKRLGVSRKKSKLLNRLVSYFEPASVLDYSDTCGLAAISLYTDNSATVHALDTQKKPIPATLKQKKNLQFFTEDLKQQLENLKQDPPQLIHVGKKHTEAQLKSIFDTIIPYTSSESIVIFDGIYQSPETAAAWEQLKNHKEIKVSLDLYFWGILFFKQDQAEQHFKIRV